MQSRSFSSPSLRSLVAVRLAGCEAGRVVPAQHGSMESLCGPGWQRSERLPGALRGTTETEQNISELLCFVSSTKMMTWHLRLFQAIYGVLFSFFFPSTLSDVCQSSLNLLAASCDTCSVLGLDRINLSAMLSVLTSRVVRVRLALTVGVVSRALL